MSWNEVYSRLENGPWLAQWLKIPVTLVFALHSAVYNGVRDFRWGLRR